MLDQTPSNAQHPQWSLPPAKVGQSLNGNYPSSSTQIFTIIVFSIITILSDTMFTNLGFFFPPTAAGSVWPHLLLPFVQIFALALPPFPHRSTIFVPLMCGLVLLTWRNLCTDSVDLRALMMGQWPWYLGGLVKLLYHDPEIDFWRADRAKSEAFYMKGLSAEKWKWAAALYCSPRLIGWNQQVKGVPSSTVAKNKKEFVVQRMKVLALCFVFIDLNNLYNHTYFYRAGVDPTTLTINGLTIYRSLLNYVLGFLGVVCNFTWLYNQIAIVSVLLGGGAPKDWPHLYGPISETYTLRLYWNTFWHQTVRFPLTAFAKGVKQQLEIKPGTFLSKYSELYMVFTLSALFHGISTLGLPVPKEEARTDWYMRFWGWFLFMFVQALGITIEDGVIWAWQNLVVGKKSADTNGVAKGGLNGELKRHATDKEVVDGEDTSVSEGKPSGTTTGTPLMWQKVVGYVWVYVFWFWIKSLTVNPLLRLGVVAGNPLPFSIVQPALALTGTKDYVTQLILG